MQQYLGRDSTEFTGIPILPLDNPKQLGSELGSLIGVIYQWRPEPSCLKPD